MKDSTSEIDELLDRAEAMMSRGEKPRAEDLCKDNPSLVEKVRGYLVAFESLTRYQAKSEAISDGDLGRDAADGVDGSWRPERIGDYQVVNEISRGGMGIVYRCRQQRPRREVAVKVMQPGIVAESALKRFRLESQVLALMQDPGIAQIYEAGEADFGFGDQPYFAMELIRGNPLDEWARLHHLDDTGRVELLVKVCRAVEHAHLRGVIHRDLKPANVLVDQSGQPKVLDFGIARLTRDQETDVSTMRSSIGFLGSLPFMSPEQCSARPGEGDVRSDVYSLGVIGFLLLTEQLPHRIEDQSLLEYTRRVQESAAPRLRSVGRRFPKDLEVVIAKALEKDPDRRYQSVSEYSDDLRRFLRLEPIKARADSPFSKAWRWSKRRPWQAAAASLALVAIVASFFGINQYLAGSKAEAGRLDSESRLTAVEKVTEEMQRAAIAMSLRLETAQRRAQNMKLLRIQEVVRDDPALGEKWLAEYPEHDRGFVWNLLNSFVRRQWRLVIDTGGGNRHGIALSNDATCVALLGRELRFWNVESGHLRAKRFGTDDSGFFLFSPDGVTAASVFAKHRIRLWKVGTHEVTDLLEGHLETILCGDYSDDGRQLATGDRSGNIRIWNLASPESLSVGIETGVPVVAVRFCAAPNRLLSVDRDGAIKHWNTRSGELEKELNPIKPEVRRRPVFSPDGSLLAGLGTGGVIQIRSTDDGRILASLSDYRTRIFGFEFTADGQSLAVSGNDRKVVFWDLKTFMRRGILPLPGRARLIGFSKDGTMMATHDYRGNLVISKITQRDLSRESSIGSVGFRALQYSPRGDWFAVGDVQGNVTLVNSADHSIRRPVVSDARNLDSLVFSPTGDQLAVGHADDTIRVVDVDTSLVREFAGHRQNVRCLAYSDDGRRLVSAGHDQTIRIWDVATGECQQSLSIEPKLATVVCFDGSGDDVIYAGRDGSISLWDTQTERGTLICDATGYSIRCLATSNDGRVLASSGMDPVIRYWDLQTKQLLGESIGHLNQVNSMAFSPDGTSLASGSSDRTIRLWDSTTGDLQAILRGSSGEIHDVAFSPDGETLACVTGEPTVRLWDTSGDPKTLYSTESVDSQSPGQRSTQ